MAFDEEHIDPHGECAAEIHRLQEQSSTQVAVIVEQDVEIARLRAQLAEARAQERERCAKVADAEAARWAKPNWQDRKATEEQRGAFNSIANVIAQRIRALSPTPNQEKSERVWKPIPIRAAKAIAEEFDYDQVIIFARKVGDSGGEHCTTYGVDRKNCVVAARVGDFFKYELAKWPRSTP